MSNPPTEGAPEGLPPNGPGTAVHSTPEPPSTDAVAASEPHAHVSVLARIKEHKIVQWTLAYAAFAFAALHAATLLSDALEWPHIIVRSVTLLLIFGLPIVSILAWYHGVRALKRVSGSELIIIALLLVIGGSLLWLLPRPTSERAGTEPAIVPAAINATTNSGTDVFSPPAHSIAVLPFTDMSEKKDKEYFADGMAEEIIDLLAKIPGLVVIGRTSSFQFKAKNEDLRAIGAKLNAAYVLEGSVRNSVEQVRITAQLINTRTGAHEWSETYDRQFGYVLKLQDAIAAAVARELQLTVVSGDLQSRSTLKDTEAYDLMLRGRQAADQWDKDGLDAAVTLFKQALDRDPTSADAAAELAFAYYKEGADGFLASADAFEQARHATTTALTLDPKSARAHYVLGKIHMVYDWDWAAAEREFQQVDTLAPRSADATSGKAVLSLTLGRGDDALRQAKAALAQDPLDPNNFWLLGAAQILRGHLPEAEAAFRRMLDIRATYGYGHLYLGLIMLARGEHDTALLVLQQETADFAQQAGLAMVYYALGRRPESDATLARMLKEQADGNAALIANVYAFRGQSDEALQWLERAYAQKDAGLSLVKVEMQTKSLASDPRYKAFLRKMKLPE